MFQWKWRIQQHMHRGAEDGGDTLEFSSRPAWITALHSQRKDTLETLLECARDCYGRRDDSGDTLQGTLLALPCCTTQEEDVGIWSQPQQVPRVSSWASHLWEVHAGWGATSPVKVRRGFTDSVASRRTRILMSTSRGSGGRWSPETPSWRWRPLAAKLQRFVACWGLRFGKLQTDCQGSSGPSCDYLLLPHHTANNTTAKGGFEHIQSSSSSQWSRGI